MSHVLHEGFQEVYIESERLLIEAFGPCLPDSILIVRGLLS